MQYDQAVAPTITVPRANFNMNHGCKTAGDFDYIYPHFIEEVIPGDTWNLDTTIFARLATPLYPIMDNMYIDVHYFWIPMRLVWDNSRKFFGEQEDPGDSISYTIPTRTTAGGWAENTLGDHFGLPTGVTNIVHNALPLRCYAITFNEWFRDQNIIDSVACDTGDTDTTTNTSILKRGKRHDYFTSCIPNPQKDPTSAQSLPLGTSAPVTRVSNAGAWDAYDAGADTKAGASTLSISGSGTLFNGAAAEFSLDPDGGLIADLSTATAATIIQLRQAMQIQALIELDARAGTRYNELVYAIYGVSPPQDSYKPVYLGGGSTPININPVPQTSDDGTNGDVGRLRGYGTAGGSGNGFVKSFTEHGYILGVWSARADLTYSQGMHRKWSRSTRYDFYHPLLQSIGDEAVYTKELYYSDPSTDTGSTGTADNERVFGYQERFASYKYIPSQITSHFRPTHSASLEAWHLSEEFSGGASLPTLDQTFIEQNTPVDRAIAVNTEPHLIVDMYHNCQVARPMHMYSIPGFGQRF